MNIEKAVRDAIEQEIQRIVKEEVEKGVKEIQKNVAAKCADLPANIAGFLVKKLDISSPFENRLEICVSFNDKAFRF